MNKTILITGASSGIGKASARKFASIGWNVIATMRRPECEEELTKLPNVLVTRLDVQDCESIEKAIAAGADRFGKIDILMNNAGQAVMGTFEAATPEQVRHQFEVNVFGLMNVTKAMLPHFRANNGGLIINVSSMAGRVSMPLLSLYVSSKFAIEGFSEALSFELASQNIQVKMVEPGGVATEFHTKSIQYTYNPALSAYDEFAKETSQMYDNVFQKKMSTPEEIVEVILKAATDGSNQFRYLAGDDANWMVNQKENKSEAEYIDWIRNLYTPQLVK
jgi:short-subunit dehydrogenase